MIPALQEIFPMIGQMLPPSPTLKGKAIEIDSFTANYFPLKVIFCASARDFPSVCCKVAFSSK